MDNIASYNVARKYEKRALLILINCVAGLSIFFFGYDQGVMGGVNGNRNYASTMGFGAYDATTKIVAVNKPLLQGGIVSKPRNGTRLWARFPCLTCVIPDRSLLLAGHTLRLLPRRMVWR